MTSGDARARFLARIEERVEEAVALCRRFVRIDSQNPPGDTSGFAAAVEALLREIPDVSCQLVVGRAPATNLVARVSGDGPGRRLVFNGHLDTFPIGEGDWSRDPLGGELVDGRIYGRGACDMKAGVAASVLAFVLLAEFRAHWRGEAVLALVGDEETGGVWGTQYLLANVAEAVGDAMLNGDAGSPRVARVGEKGNLWIEVTATGVANHGAHVHLGKNAVETLMSALTRVTALREQAVDLPKDVASSITNAMPISEAISGAGEANTLREVTVNIGRIEGGMGVNTIPDTARALCDIRIPQGIGVDDIQRQLAAALDPLPEVGWRVLASTEPCWTDPAHELVQSVQANAAVTTGSSVVVNSRPGFSDARFYRHAGVPSVVYGVAANNMGGVDEFATVQDVIAVFKVHAMAAFDYLQGTGQ